MIPDFLFSAYPIIALNEFVAANRTLAISHNRPVADGAIRNSTDSNRLIAA